RQAAMAAAAEGAQGSLDLREGPLLRVVYFECGEGERGRLLWVIHHLAVDEVSWRILLEDAERAYAQVGRGEAVELGAQSTSYREWAEHLDEYGNQPDMVTELSYWRDQWRAGFCRLPIDLTEGERHEEAGQRVEVSLSMAETQAL